MRMLYPVVALLAVVTAIGCGEPTSSEQKNSSPTVNPTADNTTRPSGPKAPDFTVTMLDGSTVRLKDFAGKPVVLHFWATWCPPCRRELPIFDKMYQTYGPKGIQFLPIAVNNQREEVAKHLKQGHFHFTSALDPRATVYRRYQARFAVPTTVLVDRAGNIAEKQVGAASERKWTEMMEELVAQP